MSIVGGVDFGTLNVRVSIFDSERGKLGAGEASYLLQRSHADPLLATQSHKQHLSALEEAMRLALASSGTDGTAIEALAIDTTGSSVIPVTDSLEPLDDYYLWCDHRAWREASRITEIARETGLPAIRWCGGTYSSEWGWAKLLHWLRNNPEKRGRFATALEHCDMIAAVLCGITNFDDLPRSICAMGHKWMWNGSLGGLPDEEFLLSVDPLFRGVRAKIARGRYTTSNHLAGRLCEDWAARLGLRPDIPVPVGALDAHWDAIGAGIRIGDVVNVIGTSSCIMAISQSPSLITGVSGVVLGSIHPRFTGIEAGLSASGDAFDAIARRAHCSLTELTSHLAEYKPGQTGLLRLIWDNGDRTILVNPELGGVTLGWNLTHTAEDELFAAIEGTGFHTRIILDHLKAHQTQVNRAINTGGIPRKNRVLNRVYANVLGTPVLVPREDVTGLGSAIFAFLACGAFATIEQAQDKLCPSYEVIEPQESSGAIYEELFCHFRKLYLAFGDRHSSPVDLGQVLPALRSLASTARLK